MPPIQIGESTHHHDQPITLVSLSTISVISAIWTAAAGRDSLRHCALGRCPSVRILGTLPAYDASAGRCYAGMCRGQRCLDPLPATFGSARRVALPTRPA